MMKKLEEKVTSPSFVGQSLSSQGKTFVVKKGDNFEYVDPVDKSVAKNQVSTHFCCWLISSLCLYITVDPSKLYVTVTHNFQPLRSDSKLDWVQ